MPDRPLIRHEQTHAALALVVLLLVGAAAVAVTNSGEQQPAAAAAETIPPLRIERDDSHARVDYAAGVAWRSAEIARFLAAAADAERAAADRAAAERRSAAAAESRRADRSSRVRNPGGSGAHRGYATWYECTAAVENGGDYGRSSNRTHFGRYQFSRSTWAAYGGNPDTWGSASPAEQDAVFARAVAAGGESNWRPYNGC